MFESEELELAALEDLHRAAPDELVDALALQGFHAGSGFVSLAGALPPSAIVINRVLGLGLHSPVSREQLRQVLQRYRHAGADHFLFQLHPRAAPAELTEWLEEEGLEPVRAWQKFVRAPQPVAAPDTDLEVRLVDAREGDAFARIVCDGFDLGRDALPWLARLPGRPDWHVFMTFDRDTPVGAGTLFVRNRLGWLDFAATAPQWRQRGSQRALLSARINRAWESGCARVFACTGVDVPGDPQHSYRNLLQAGFHEDYIRANYAPSAPNK